MRLLFALAVSMLAVVAAAQAVAPSNPVAISTPEAGLPVTLEGRVVSVGAPDGGALRVGVDDSVRLDVSASTAPGTYLAVAGDSSGTILRTQLNAASLNSLLSPTCTRGRPEVVTIGMTPTQLPRDAGHVPSATQWTLVNLSNNRQVCCLPSLDGGSGSLDCASLAYIIAPSYGSVVIDGQNITDTIHCKVNTTDPAVTATVNVWEASCIQQ